MKAVLINKYYGRVRRVSGDKSQVTVGLPRGGTITCDNRGFDVGDEVCFIFNTARTKVIRLIPKDIADARVKIGSNPILGSFLNSVPPSKDELDQQEDLDYEIVDEDEIAIGGESGPYPADSDDEDPYGDSGQIPEEMPDLRLEDHRDDVEEWADPNEYPAGG